MSLLRNKIAVVTGASGGIGRVIVDLFIEHGARVIGVDWSEPPPLATAPDSRAFTFVQGDVGAQVTIERLADIAAQMHGHLDILVNNAAILPSSSSLDALADSDWEHVLQMNVLSVVKLSARLLPLMRSASYGRIINIGSVLSTHAVPLGGPYVVSKHALLGLTRTQALEYGRIGITANCILPGGVDTKMFRRNDSNGEFRRYVESKCPLGRAADPSEIAATVLFLASPLSSYVNGHALVVDGGLTAGIK